MSLYTRDASTFTCTLKTRQTLIADFRENRRIWRNPTSPVRSFVIIQFVHPDIGAVLSLLDPLADLDFEGPEVIPWAGNWHGREGWARFFQTIADNAEQQSQPKWRF